MFRVGDRVKIAKTSQFYDRRNSKDASNPPDIEGYIIEIEGDFLPIQVAWDTGRQNGYGDIDLELATPAPTPTSLVKLETSSLHA